MSHLGHRTLVTIHQEELRGDEGGVGPRKTIRESSMVVIFIYPATYSYSYIAQNKSFEK